MLVKITNKAVSGAGRTYFNDILGRTFFPKTKDMEINVNDYAYVVKTQQTKTFGEDGVTLIDLKEPIEILQVTAAWPTKVAAIEAAAEAGTLDVQVAAEVTKVAKELNLTDAQVARMAEAAF